MPVTSRGYELIGVAFSHYVEKARWALDRFGVRYTDTRYMPLMHLLPVFLIHRGRAGRPDRASTRFSTPVLRTPTGDVLCDSGDIVRYVSNRYAPTGYDLFPPDARDTRQLEQRLHDKLGPHGRRIVYAVCFRKPSLLVSLAHDNVPPRQARAFSLAMPLVQIAMKRVLSLDEGSEQRSLDVTRREMDWVSSLLADGRPYLAGDRFTSLDLSFACMAVPCVMPPEFAAVLPPLHELPDDARELVAKFRETPAGAFALRLFADERRRIVDSSTA